MSEHIKVEIADDVITLTLRRPGKQNALTALARRLAGSLHLTKALTRDPERIAARIAEESLLFMERLTTPEARGAFAAFAEKRPPDFSKLQG